MTRQQDRCTDTSNLLISFTQDGSYSSSKNILVTKMSISTYCNKHCLPKPSIKEQHSVAMATANVHEQLTGATEYITELSHLSLSLVIQGDTNKSSFSLYSDIEQDHIFRISHWSETELQMSNTLYIYHDFF